MLKFPKTSQSEQVDQWLGQANENHAAGQLEAAEACYRRAIEHDPKAADARLKLAVLLNEMGRASEAADLLGQLLTDHPKLSAGWVQLALIVAARGFDWEAHQAVAKAMKFKPDAPTLVAASMVLMTLHDLSAAERACRRAINVAPRTAAAWVQLGQVLGVDGRKGESMAAYQRALAIDPNNAVAKFLLAAGAAGDSRQIDEIAKVAGTNAGVDEAPGMSAAGAAVPCNGAATDSDQIAAVASAPADYVRGLFDGFAENFDDLLRDSLRYRAPELLDQLLSRYRAEAAASAAANANAAATAAIPATMTMLDAGCGTGLCGLWMARYRGRLIGVDLSRGMLAKARQRDVYDELIAGDVVAELRKRQGDLDLIVAGDVMVYLGDLAPAFAAAASALRSAGVFLFSTELSPGADYVLRSTHRFAHHPAYIHRLARVSGLTLGATEQAVLRLEKGADVRGQLFLLQKPVG
jgi:predicted TPR repeat methyltransferase